jgi:dienelactone hydrolase
MKKIILLIFSLCVGIFNVEAQRPPLDSMAVASWPVIVNVKLAADGKFALYLAGPSRVRGKTLFVVETDGRQKMTLDSVAEASFTGDAKYVAARTVGGSLVILDLSKGTRRIYGEVRSLVIPKEGKSDVVAVELMSGQLMVLKAGGGDPDNLGKAGRAEFDRSGRWLLWCRKVGSGLEQWSYFDCDRHQGRVFWTGSSMGTLSFEGTSGKTAFLARDGATGSYSIWKYEIGADSAWCWLKNVVDQHGDSMVIEDGWLDFFRALDAWLFHVHKRFRDSDTKGVSPGVRVWRYTDEYGSPMTLGTRPDKNRNFLAIGYEGSSKMVRMGMEGDWPGDPTMNLDGNGVYAVTMTVKNVNEGYRLAGERPDVYLISLKDGSRNCIKRELEFTDVKLSPGGKYIWWYDRKERSYFTYVIETGKVNNVGKGGAMPWSDEEWDEAADPFEYGLGCWIADDAGMLVYDRYDIWKLDPAGIYAPINITKGFGRSHKIKMRFVSYNSFLFEEPPPMKKGDRPLVAALDEETKANVFFRISLDGKGEPEKEILMMGELCYYPETINFVSIPSTIIKADGADVFLVQKMGADKFPNLYATKDFRRFVAMSSMAPEKKYNWLTSELVHWKTFEGRDGAAILYKPTDFDSTRKYSVIFYCYERQTPGLNEYKYPECSTGAMNIPWFVSRDYLVVCPDIRYEVGNPGEGIYDYVVSGVDYMKGKSWVAPDRIGVEGHSWGGFEVNYLVTRTNAFRCAVAASGLSNLSSMYGLEGFSGASGPSFVEAASTRMGGTLSDSVESYVENSPVFQARKIETPLLLMSNDKDANVPWEQGVELFTALRRLEKKVWLLEYPGEIHSVGIEHAWDFTRRLTDYFDYYLKNEPEPDWMRP